MFGNKKYLAHVDFEVLLRKLTARAAHIFAKLRCFDPNVILPGVAQSSQDLAQNALLVFLEEDKWRPTVEEDDPFPYVFTIMRNDFMDLLRSSAYKTTEKKSDYDYLCHVIKIVAMSEAVNDIDKGILREQLYKLVDDQQLMKDYLVAVFEMGLYEHEEIANVLGVETKEIAKLRKKLIYTINKRLTQ